MPPKEFLPSRAITQRVSAKAASIAELRPAKNKCDERAAEHVNTNRKGNMELLRRFAQGDVEAFEALFRQFQGAVYGWILRIVREPFVADELTVEVFWRAYRSRTRFDPEASFGAWTRRIATNLAIDHLRRRRATVELPEDLASRDSPDPAMCRETRERIRAAFCRLPAKLRAAATLALIEDTPYGEIAAALGISAVAVRMRVFRAVRTLRKELNRMGLKP